MNARDEKRRVAASSVIASAFLTLAKLVTGLATGSLGVLSEAAHSGLDFVAALSTYLAVRSSSKPADVEHHFGHQKAESVAAFFEMILLFIACLWIILEAIRRLVLRTFEIEPTYYAFGVMLTSIAVDISRARALSRAAKKHASQALAADAVHFSSDVLSSSVVVAGLILARFGFHIADPIASIGVAGVIIFIGLKLTKSTIDVLMDKSPSGARELIYREISSVKGVDKVDRIRIRQSGPQCFVDVELSMPSSLDVEKAHEIAQEVENRILSIFPGSDVMVHANPGKQHGDLISTVKHAALDLPVRAEVHNIQLFDSPFGTFIDLHLRVPRKLSLYEAHELSTKLEELIKRELGDQVQVTIKAESEASAELERALLKTRDPELLDRVKEILDSQRALKGYHSIKLRKTEEGTYHLSMHCLYDGKANIEEVSELNHQLEHRIRSEIPQVKSVTIHSEPMH